MSDRPAAARATLERLGLDVDALLAGAASADVVARLVAGPDGDAVLEALGDLPAAPVAKLLVELGPDAASRETRRALRRALYRLRQQGVPIPDAEPTASAPPAPRTEPDIEGLVSAVDGRGDRLLWLVRALDTGGWLLVAGQVNEPAGLRDGHAVEVGRKALRTARARLEKQSGLRLVPADWRIVDALLVEAHERAASTERTQDYLRVRPRLTRDPPAPPAEPASARATAPDGDEAATLLARSATLLDEPEFRTWWPSAEAMAPIVEEIATLRDSPLVVSPGAQEERLRAVLRRAATTLAPPPVFARRLAANAYILAETGRVPAARQALAVARALDERPNAAGDVPFVAAYVERAVGALLAAETARAEEEQRGSLVMTPAQFLKARASSHRERTRG